MATGQRGLRFEALNRKKSRELSLPGLHGRSVLATGPLPRKHPYPNARAEQSTETRHSLATGGLGKGGIDEKGKNL